MGYFKRMAEQARKVSSSKATRPKRGALVAVQPIVTDKMDEMLAKVPHALRMTALKQATRGTAKIAANAFEAYAPDSDETGTKEYWSAKVKEQRSHGIGLQQAASYKQLRVRRNLPTVTALAGFERPYGNHLHLIAADSFPNEWGRDDYFYFRANRFMDVALDATRSRMIEHMYSTVRRHWPDA